MGRAIYTTKIPGILSNAERYADQVIRKGAYDILGRSQSDVPVRTGNLKTSGHVDTEAGGLRATIGYSAEYAAYVELGTRRMPARPFLRPAFDAVAPQIAKALERVTRP